MSSPFPEAVNDFPRPTFTTNTDDTGFELDVIVNGHSQAIEEVEEFLAFQPFNAQTGTTYTCVAADTLKLLTLTNASPITLTVPSGVFIAGQRIDGVQRGVGAVTLVGSGVTLNPPPGLSLVTEGRYAYFSIYFHSSTVADVTGLMAAP